MVMFVGKDTRLKMKGMSAEEQIDYLGEKGYDVVALSGTNDIDDDLLFVPLEGNDKFILDNLSDLEGLSYIINKNGLQDFFWGSEKKRELFRKKTPEQRKDNHA